MISKVVINSHGADGTSLKALASVLVADAVWITGVRVVEAKNKNLFVSMPSRRNPDSTYSDIAFPATLEVRQALEKAVLDEYHRPDSQRAS